MDLASSCDSSCDSASSFCFFTVDDEDWTDEAGLFEAADFPDEEEEESEDEEDELEDDEAEESSSAISFPSFFFVFFEKLYFFPSFALPCPFGWKPCRWEDPLSRSSSGMTKGRRISTGLGPLQSEPAVSLGIWLGMGYKLGFL